MECREKMGRVVLPIFYDVDPSVVRKQTGTYAQAFDEHEIRYQENIEKVHAWRNALKDVANISGWSLQDRPESEFIQDIVKMISHNLSNAFPRDTKDLVGVDSQVKELMSLLAIGSNDVRIIGVWGMGGIGKTTLAKAVYWKVLSEFEGGCFITNIREVFENFGLLPLQQKLICDILMEENVNIRDVDDGVHMIKNRLCHKRVLLVLDDVNQFKQLENLAGGLNWFGQGSRVIITTRDEHLLIRHRVFDIYEARILDDDDALRLFSLKAFNKDHPIKNYLEMSKHFVNYAKGLPLAIDVLGSFLCNRKKEEWESVLDRLKKFPEKDIMKRLQISFDGLQETEKEIFLYIAYFFNMKEKDYVVKVLDRLGLCPKIGLRVLIEKSLFKHCENTFWMHELLQTMGKDIVRQEPQKWSKFLLYNDSRNALKKNMECEAIEGLVFELGDQHISKEGIYEEPEIHSVAALSIVVPGSNIPRWFKPQNVGKMVIAQVVPSHLCNKWMGMAVCAVFSCHLLHSRKNCSMELCFLHCHIEVNKLESVEESAIFSYKFARIGSHHLWLLYFHPECFKENARAVLSQIEENKIIEMEVRFEDSDNSCLEVKKCGFQMLYEQDIEDIREMMAPHSKSCSISPYEGSDAQQDFDNSMVVKEGSKIKRSHDNYNGAGPSGEGRSNDVPHSKEDSKIKGCLAHCSSGSLPIILLQGLVQVGNKLRNGLSQCCQKLS